MHIIHSEVSNLVNLVIIFPGLITRETTAWFRRRVYDGSSLKYTLTLCCSSADAGCYSYRELGLQGNSRVYILHRARAYPGWISMDRKYPQREAEQHAVVGHVYGVSEVCWISLYQTVWFSSFLCLLVGSYEQRQILNGRNYHNKYRRADCPPFLYLLFHPLTSQDK